MSFEWNLIRLGGPAHGIVTKTVHKTLSWGGGGRGWGSRGWWGQGVVGSWEWWGLGGGGGLEVVVWHSGDQGVVESRGGGG